MTAQKKKKLEGGLRVKDGFKRSSLKTPLVTVITAVYNSCNHLEETILSIANQEYKDVEYIIIDGGSTDETLAILEKFNDKIDYWISEPDKGISDAFNKGISFSTGTYINFQGAGDLLDTDKTLNKIFLNLKGEPMFISGRIKRVSESDSNNTLYISKDNQGKKFMSNWLLWKMSFPHQGLFTHKDYFKKYGLFKLDLKYSMDYEHLLRAYKNFPEVVFVDVVARWRADGLGNGKELEIYEEYDLIKRKNEITHSFILSVVNYWTIMKFYFKKLIR